MRPRGTEEGRRKGGRRGFKKLVKACVEARKRATQARVVRLFELAPEDTYAAHLKPSELAPWLSGDLSGLPKAPPGRGQP